MSFLGHSDVQKPAMKELTAGGPSSPGEFLAMSKARPMQGITHHEIGVIAAYLANG